MHNGQDQMLKYHCNVLRYEQAEMTQYDGEHRRSMMTALPVNDLHRFDDASERFKTVQYNKHVFGRDAVPDHVT